MLVIKTHLPSNWQFVLPHIHTTKRIVSFLFSPKLLFILLFIMRFLYYVFEFKQGTSVWNKFYIVIWEVFWQPQSTWSWTGSHPSLPPGTLECQILHPWLATRNCTRICTHNPRPLQLLDNLLSKTVNPSPLYKATFTPHYGGKK